MTVSILQFTVLVLQLLLAHYYIILLLHTLHTVIVDECMIILLILLFIVYNYIIERQRVRAFDRVFLCRCALLAYCVSVIVIGFSISQTAPGGPREETKYGLQGGGRVGGGAANAVTVLPRRRRRRHPAFAAATVSVHVAGVFCFFFYLYIAIAAPDSVTAECRFRNAPVINKFTKL